VLEARAGQFSSQNSASNEISWGYGFAKVRSAPDPAPAPSRIQVEVEDPFRRGEFDRRYPKIEKSFHLCTDRLAPVPPPAAGGTASEFTDPSGTNVGLGQASGQPGGLPGGRHPLPPEYFDVLACEQHQLGGPAPWGPGHPPPLGAFGGRRGEIADFIAAAEIRMFEGQAAGSAALLAATQAAEKDARQATFDGAISRLQEQNFAPTSLHQHQVRSAPQFVQTGYISASRLQRHTAMQADASHNQQLSQGGLHGRRF